LVGVCLPWLAWRVSAFGLGWLARVGRCWLAWGALADRVRWVGGVGCLSPGAGCVSPPCVRMSIPCPPCHLARPAHSPAIVGASYILSYSPPLPIFFLALSRWGCGRGCVALLPALLNWQPASLPKSPQPTPRNYFHFAY